MVCVDEAWQDVIGEAEHSIGGGQSLSRDLLNKPCE
jgi:hypothetical protein